MKILNIFQILLAPIFFASSGCEKPNKEPNEYYGAYQKACVRLKVQNNTSDGRKAQVVGDSAAVWKAVRWGTTLHNYNMVVGAASEYGIPLTRWDLYGRDTTECVYIFGYENVVLYGRLEPDENGIWNGVPGSEKWGVLMICENMVISGMYDETLGTYLDPYLIDEWDFADHKIHYDTFAYIPNSIVRANRERLIPLFDEGKYSEMMKIMENDYTIYTCTGEEYRELARQGLN